MPTPPGSRLDPHHDRYAERAQNMTASEIRALFAVASRPEVVSLAGGMPYLRALPLDDPSGPDGLSAAAVEAVLAADPERRGNAVEEVSRA